MNGEVLDTSETPEAFVSTVGTRKTVFRIETGIISGSVKGFSNLKEEQMNIYVGNLSYEVTEEDLKDAFSAFGQVDTVKVIKDEYSGRSKGFGFVEMQDNSSAQSAIDGLDGKELKGRAVKVNQARARTEGSRSGGGRGKGRPGGGGRQGGGQRY
jgi:RNA recognition motif-containing protein